MVLDYNLNKYSIYKYISNFIQYIPFLRIPVLFLWNPVSFQWIPVPFPWIPVPFLWIPVESSHSCRNVRGIEKYCKDTFLKVGLDPGTIFPKILLRLPMILQDPTGKVKDNHNWHTLPNLECQGLWHTLARNQHTPDLAHQGLRHSVDDWAPLCWNFNKSVDGCV